MAQERPKQRVYQIYPAASPLRNWEGGDAPPDLVRRPALYTISGRAANRPKRPRRFFRLVPVVLLLAVIAALSYTYRGIESFFRGRPRVVLNAALPSSHLFLDLPELESSDQLRVFHKVRPKENWGMMLSRYGFRAEDAAEIEQAIGHVEKERDVHAGLRPGQVLEFRLGRHESLAEVIFPVDAEHEVTLERDRRRGFVGELVQLHREQAERVAVGVIQSSFAAAARQAGVSYQTVDDLVDLFSDRVDFKQDLRVGDRFTVIFRDQVSRGGVQIGVGPILAAALDVNGQRLIAARYVGTDGKSRYFDGKGALLGNSFLRYPLTFSRISSYFSFARFHPILGRSRPHNGVDFAAPVGTPVRTVADGTVLFAGRKGEAGIMVQIRHSERYTTAYLHLSKIAPSLRDGMRVERGQVIGAVGATGLATGPHLHYSFYDNGKYVDPLKIKLPYLDTLGAGLKMDGEYLRRVLYTLNHYQALHPNRLYAG